jgi:hypothetical protein
MDFKQIDIRDLQAVFAQNEWNRESGADQQLFGRVDADEKNVSDAGFGFKPQGFGPGFISNESYCSAICKAKRCRR